MITEEEEEQGGDTDMNICLVACLLVAAQPYLAF